MSAAPDGSVVADMPTVATVEAWAIGDLRLHPEAEAIPAMRPEEHDGLLEDIEEHGVQVPLDILEDGIILDGRHRWRVAATLGIAWLPCRVVRPADPFLYMWRMAVVRRHLTRGQRAMMVARLLERDPGASDRRVAAEAGVDHRTVGRIRERMESTGEIPQSTERTGIDGRTRGLPDARHADRGEAEPEGRPDPECWVRLQRAMDEVRRLRAGRVADLAYAVPPMRKASTARELRRLGMVLGSIAARLEDWVPERDDDGEAAS